MPAAPLGAIAEHSFCKASPDSVPSLRAKASSACDANTDIARCVSDERPPAASVPLEPGFTHDVSDVGHFGTGDLEITLSNSEDLERAMPLLKRSYENS
jgi:hypothetical protein